MDPLNDWCRDGDVIRLHITSDGKKPEEWLKEFGTKKIYVTEKAREVILNGLNPTQNISTEIVIIDGNIFKGLGRTLPIITEKAYSLGLSEITIEEKNNIRHKLTDKAIEKMGFWKIVGMHKPIACRDGLKRILSSTIRGCGNMLRVFQYVEDEQWLPTTGFAFAKRK